MPSRHAWREGELFRFQIQQHPIQKSGSLIKENKLRLSSKAFTALATVGAIAAIGASPASAAPVPATFNATDGFLWSGTVTVSHGTQSTTCALSQGGNASNIGTPLQGNIVAGVGANPVNCANGFWFTFQIYNAKTWKDAGVFTVNQTTGSSSNSARLPFYSLNSYWSRTAWSAPAAWTNGTAFTPSTMTFNNTTVGTSGGAPVRVTGTINMTRQGGTLLTLL